MNNQYRNRMSIVAVFCTFLMISSLVIAIATVDFDSSRANSIIWSVFQVIINFSITLMVLSTAFYLLWILLLELLTKFKWGVKTQVMIIRFENKFISLCFIIVALIVVYFLMKS